MAMKICNQPGCGKLISDLTSHCPRHVALVKTEKEAGRKTAHQRGYTSKWRTARLGFLSKHPLCVLCRVDGVVTEATVVDHIEPHRMDKVLFWCRDNWQSLCKKCHDHKTATEDGGFTGGGS